MEVVWKMFGDYYRVSNTGVVQSRAGKRGKHRDTEILNEWRTKKLCWGKTDNHGGAYFSTSLRVGGVFKSYRVHRLVAELFCEKRENCNEVDHIDGNRANNYASNLRWVNRQENAVYAAERGAFANCRPPGVYKRDVDMGRCHKMYAALASGKTNKEVADEFNVDPSSVSNFRLGKTFVSFFDETGLPPLTPAYIRKTGLAAKASEMERKRVSCEMEYRHIKRIRAFSETRNFSDGVAKLLEKYESLIAQKE